MAESSDVCAPPARLDPQADWPQTASSYLPGHIEAYWAYGYDEQARLGYYMYLLADDDTGITRRERVYLCLPDGSVLAWSDAGTGSRAGVAAGSSVEFACQQPFSSWQARMSAPMRRLPADALATGPTDESAEHESGEYESGERYRDAQVELRLDLTAATPAWDTEGETGEQLPGYRYHQLMRARGSVTIDGRETPLSGPCFRSHSRRRRDLPGFTGHIIANALLPDGRAFGVLTYRDAAGGIDRGRGFYYDGATLHRAELTQATFLDGTRVSGGKLSLTLQGDFGSLPIEAEQVATVFKTITPGSRGIANSGRTDVFGAHLDEPDGVLFSFGFARYTVDGQSAVGPCERSVVVSALNSVAAMDSAAGA